MDTNRLHNDIKIELASLRRLENEMKYLSEMLHNGESFVEIRAAGSIIHDFYSGIEKVFERIAMLIDGSIPKGESWHVELLSRMAQPFEDKRTEVISEGLFQILKEYLRFRHLFRNIYGFQLNWELFRKLCEEMTSTLDLFSEEINTFLEIMQNKTR